MVSAGQVYLPVVMSQLFALLLPTQSAERLTEDLVQTIADGLERGQIKSGPLKGSWLYEVLRPCRRTARSVIDRERMTRSEARARGTAIRKRHRPSIDRGR